ncbi:MAG: amidohydrolase [Hydrogenoanaerobacterium sp.]
MEEGLQPEAVLTEDGVITAVGDYNSLFDCAKNAELVDLAGKTMLPAFIDAHSHFSSYATSFLQVSLEDCTSFGEIDKKIRQFITENDVSDGQWVNCRGYDHNSLAEKCHPSLSFMDSCAPNNPLVLQHASGHVGVFNTMALAELGITSSTEAPAGGVIGRKDGVLTGYMEENAFFTYLKKVPMADMTALMSAFKKAQDGYAAHGIATIQEGMMVGQLIPLYKMLLGLDMLKLDVVAYADKKDSEDIFEAFPDSLKKYNAHFKLGGYKIFLDGSPQGRTAWMKAPYAGEADYCGYGTMQDDEVIAAVRLAAKNNMQILAHCNGDAAAQQYIDAVKTVSRESGVAKLRPVMIHAQLLAKEQLADVKALGIIPSFFVAHVFHWGDIHIKNFGAKRAAQISPAYSALKHDILFTFHQDTPVIEPNMPETLWCAVNRMTKDGTVLGSDECISVYDALRAVTINAAYQYFEEDKKGSIRVGKFADFVILDKNPLTVEQMSIRDIKVLATIKSDKVLFLSGKNKE